MPTKRWCYVLRKAGYLVHMVDEYKTTKICHSCGSTTTCGKLNTNTGKVNTGVLYCPKCDKCIDRDENGALNIRFLGLADLRGDDRPQAFRRGQPAVPAPPPQPEKRPLAENSASKDTIAQVTPAPKTRKKGKRGRPTDDLPGPKKGPGQSKPGPS